MYIVTISLAKKYSVIVTHFYIIPQIQKSSDFYFPVEVELCELQQLSRSKNRGTLYKILRVHLNSKKVEK